MLPRVPARGEVTGEVIVVLMLRFLAGNSLDFLFFIIPQYPSPSQ